MMSFLQVGPIFSVHKAISILQLDLSVCLLQGELVLVEEAKVMEVTWETASHSMYA